MSDSNSDYPYFGEVGHHLVKRHFGLNSELAKKLTEQTFSLHATYAPQDLSPILGLYRTASKQVLDHAEFDPLSHFNNVVCRVLSITGRISNAPWPLFWAARRPIDLNSAPDIGSGRFEGLIVLAGSDHELFATGLQELGNSYPYHPQALVRSLAISPLAGTFSDAYHDLVRPAIKEAPGHAMRMFCGPASRAAPKSYLDAAVSLRRKRL